MYPTESNSTNHPPCLTRHRKSPVDQLAELELQTKQCKLVPLDVIANEWFGGMAESKCKRILQEQHDSSLVNLIRCTDGVFRMKTGDVITSVGLYFGGLELVAHNERMTEKRKREGGKAAKKTSKK